MTYGTLMLDDTGDVIGGVWPDGSETVGVAVGVNQVAQAASLAVSTAQGSAWFNISAGIDFNTLFFDARGSDASMAGVRSSAFRSAVLAVPGIQGFVDSKDINFSREGRSVSVSVPCVLIDCDSTLASATINSLG